jgi:hypothetical protein
MPGRRSGARRLPARIAFIAVLPTGAVSCTSASLATHDGGASSDAGHTADVLSDGTGTDGACPAGLFYDQVNDITWLVDANLAATQRFGLPTCVGSLHEQDGLSRAHEVAAADDAAHGP